MDGYMQKEMRREADPSDGVHGDGMTTWCNVQGFFPHFNFWQLAASCLAASCLAWIVFANLDETCDISFDIYFGEPLFDSRTLTGP